MCVCVGGCACLCDLNSWWDVFLASQFRSSNLPLDRNLVFRALLSISDEDSTFLAMRFTTAFMSGAAKATRVRNAKDMLKCQRYGADATMMHDIPASLPIRK